MTTLDRPAVSAKEFEAIVRDEVPFVGAYGVRVEAIVPGRLTLLLPYRDDLLRPGGTITGPALFGLADVGLYGAVMSRLGPVALAVTTSMTINFLRRPPPADIRAEASLLKLGRRLAYGEVLLYSVDEADPVAHATGTYSIPPKS